MRLRTAILPLAVAAVAVTLAPARAALVQGAGPGHFTSDNVEWIKVEPRHAGSSGGRLHGGYFYVTDGRGVTIYDVTDPAAPRQTGFLAVPQAGTGAALSQEDPDTNGKILLVDAVNPSAPTVSTARRDANRLLVVDVRDKTAPKVVGSVDVADHTWTCVLDCTYAIGRSGNIVDLTDPTTPVKLPVDWKGAAPAGYTHDFTEVAPGRIMSAGQPSWYIDASALPAQVTGLNTIASKFSTLGYHGAQWARGGRDRFLLMGTEISPSPAGSDCQGSGTEIAAFDATQVIAADDFQAANPDEPRPEASFQKVATWRVSGRGTFTDGKAAGNTVLYCGHWFDLHPKWEDGGLIAMGYYDWGTRFLKVEVVENGDDADDVTFSEVGWFQPAGGLTSAAYWINDEIVYTLDYRRGLDILRFKDAQG